MLIPNLYVWDATTGELQQKLVQPLASPPSGLTWCCSPDGETVATCGSNPATYVRLWSFTTGQRLKDFLDYDHVVALDFGSDGRAIALGTRDDKVVVLDKFSGVIDASFSISKVRSLHFSPKNGDILAIGSGSAMVQHLSGGNSFAFPDAGRRMLEAAFTADGERIVTTSEDRILTIWDGHTGKQIYAVNPHAARINCLAIDPKNTLIAISSGNGIVSFWDATTGQLVSVWLDPERTAAHCITFSLSGGLVAVAVLNGVYMLDPKTVFSSIPHLISEKEPEK
jgi:WD40 repeat protein